ncbi:MAG: nucleotidyltransferase family protein, partial [Gammaproteobacteria bacterium]|nr:nucleotidyltransferase family protein [Gammaproteobacteria bacterium]
MDSALQNIITILNHEPINSENINFEKLFQMGAQHRINGQVQLALKKHYAHENKLLDFFKEHRRFQQYQSIKQASAAVELYKLAQAAGKAIIFFKGVTLSQQLYQDVSVRSSHDIDVLVQSNDVFWFDKALREQGYQISRFPSLQKKYEHIFFRNHKDILYQHPVKKIFLELHWRFGTENQFSNLQYDSFVTAKNPTLVKINNHELPIPPDPLNFIYLCYHAETHFCERLHWMYDTLLYANKINSDDWDTIFNYAEKNEVKTHLNYLITRWKTFFPSLSKNIPTPSTKKVKFYPIPQEMFENNTFIKKNTYCLQKVLCRITINKSFINAVKIALYRVGTNHIVFCLKHNIPK